MSTTAEFLPWQEALASRWLQNRERFAHAWLIHGLAGIGKRQFARAAAAGLLCEKPVRSLACGQCQACRWVAAGHHPDLRVLRPDAVALEEGESSLIGEGSEGGAKKTPSKDIRIDQLRALQGWFTTATHRGGWRVAVLYPAEALNLIVANALLKILEEPPPHTVFLIVADAPDRLLPTLVSRCRRLPLPVPAQSASLEWLAQEGLQQAHGWLAAAGGAPVLALRRGRQHAQPCPAWLQDFLQPLASGDTPAIGALADSVERIEPSEWIDALQRLFLDLLLAAHGVQARYFPSMQPSLHAVASRASVDTLANMAKWLAEQQSHARHPLNSKLLAHVLLQRAALACAPSAG